MHNDLDALPLITTLHDIAQHELRESQLPKTPAGPNSWTDVRPEDFGEHYDFEILDQGERWVFYPVCKAAEMWASRYLHDDQRWGAKGYIVPHPLNAAYSKSILADAFQDNLYSEDDRAAENDNLQRQGK